MDLNNARPYLNSLYKIPILALYRTTPSAKLF